MTPKEALEIIRKYGKRGWYVITAHALSEMKACGAQGRDVEHALIQAASCEEQTNGTWRVESSDRVGDALSLVVALEENVIIVTVW